MIFMIDEVMIENYIIRFRSDQKKFSFAVWIFKVATAVLSIYRFPYVWNSSSVITEMPCYLYLSFLLPAQSVQASVAVESLAWDEKDLSDFDDVDGPSEEPFADEDRQGRGEWDVYCWGFLSVKLAPGKFKWNFWSVIFKLTLVTDGWVISCEIPSAECLWFLLMMSPHWFR